MTIKVYKRTATSNGEYFLCDSYKDVSNYSLTNTGIILMLSTEESQIIEKTILHFSTQVDYKIEITEQK